ncbi:hypothetical protein ABI59_05915 [Acidobacteria bacterium Mor1]|nr:hypothetical protein ABI59_05915 [Acidobacteria bacterium Mor1]
MVALFVFVYWAQSSSRKKRRALLMAKYDDEQVVNDIIGQVMWQGETADQLLESLGSPAAKDEKLLKTKSKEIWKYGHEGGNRYRLRVTVEDGVVVGWDQRS